ncbi:hypothetical protein IW147_004317 [Coemansia sp. RSA 720]|nr:hypothetical protein IW147_004317 [Coemansia sp. RSA 720]
MKLNLPGMREEECFTWSCTYVDDTLGHTTQLYLQSQLRQHPHSILAPSTVDSSTWLYEHMRQLCTDIGFLVCQLRSSCTPTTCPVMRANASTYYCAGSHVHPRPCSAIAYSVHTLDFAVRQVCGMHDGARVKHCQSIVRRLYRVFAHAYFHHRDVFERVESATGVYARFVNVARKYELAPESQIIIPELPTTC